MAPVAAARIRLADPFEDGAARLLHRSHALMESLFPPEDNHYLSLDDLRAPNIRFFVAERPDDGQILVTGAIALDGEQAEVKSMFADEGARGQGLGRAMLRHLEAEARAAGARWLRLETGDRLHAALALYESAGFVRRGPFGAYCANGTSVFMEKTL